MLFDGFADFGEGFWIVDGEVGEDFAVEFDAFFLHAVDELAVIGAVFMSGIIDTSDPKGAEVAFLVATIAVSVA